MADGSELTWVSELNLRTEVLGENAFPREMGVYDTTLRDGEQTVGLTFDKHEKLEIARTLDRLGVDRIEAGMPVVSKEDRDAVEMIAGEGLKAEIWGFCRCVESDIDACAASGVRAVVVEIPTSSYKMRATGMTPESILERLVRQLQHAKEHGLYTAFFSVDATRSDLGFLREVYTRAVEEGKADETVIVDTLGVATPETMYFLTKQLLSWVKVPVMVHCHNDFGLATACTLAGLKAGASWVQTTINGLGEKTGNTDMAEVALVAEVLYGMSTRIRLDRVYEAALRVAEITGVPLSPLKPIVGANAFRRETGVAVAQLVKYPPAGEGFAPELVGRQREIVLGKKSGKHSIEYMLRKLGLTASDEEVGAILEQVKQLSIDIRGPITEKQFRRIVNRVTARQE
ncbi:MAG: homocitrate synthase/isopropylmalate synthase family protein [Chloroflexota bacterium]